MIEHGLSELVGVINVDVNNVADTVLVEFDPSAVTCDEIKNHLRKL